VQVVLYTWTLQFTTGHVRPFSMVSLSTTSSHGLMLVRDSKSQCTSDSTLTVTCYTGPMPITILFMAVPLGECWQVTNDVFLFGLNVRAFIKVARGEEPPPPPPKFSFGIPPTLFKKILLFQKSKREEHPPPPLPICPWDTHYQFSINVRLSNEIEIHRDFTCS